MRIFSHPLRALMDTYPNSSSALGTRTLLQHFANISVDGLLSTKFITSVDDPVIRSLDSELQWLNGWFAAWSAKSYKAKEERARSFLAPITYQQCVLTLTGMLGLVKSYFRDFPGHGMCLRRVNQSRLESFFGRVRQLSGCARVITAMAYRSCLAKVAVMEEERFCGLLHDIALPPCPQRYDGPAVPLNWTPEQQSDPRAVDAELDQLLLRHHKLCLQV